jgi:hypothetical protein
MLASKVKDFKFSFVEFKLKISHREFFERGIAYRGNDAKKQDGLLLQLLADTKFRFLDLFLASWQGGWYEWLCWMIGR